MASCFKKMVPFVALLAATATVDGAFTWDESDGIALRSDKYHGMMLIFR